MNNSNNSLKRIRDDFEYSNHNSNHENNNINYKIIKNENDSLINNNNNYNNNNNNNSSSSSSCGSDSSSSSCGSDSSNNSEIKFWKIIKNRFLFNKIIQLLKSQFRYKVYNYDQVKSCRWMLNNGHLGLLKLKVERCEYIVFNKCLNLKEKENENIEIPNIDNYTNSKIKEQLNNSNNNNNNNNSYNSHNSNKYHSHTTKSIFHYYNNNINKNHNNSNSSSNHHQHHNNSINNDRFYLNLFKNYKYYFLDTSIENTIQLILESDNVGALKVLVDNFKQVLSKDLLYHAVRVGSIEIANYIYDNITISSNEKKSLVKRLLIIKNKIDIMNKRLNFILNKMGLIIQLKDNNQYNNNQYNNNNNNNNNNSSSDNIVELSINHLSFYCTLIFKEPLKVLLESCKLISSLINNNNNNSSSSSSSSYSNNSISASASNLNNNSTSKLIYIISKDELDLLKFTNDQLNTLVQEFTNENQDVKRMVKMFIQFSNNYNWFENSIGFKQDYQTLNSTFYDIKYYGRYNGIHFNKETFKLYNPLLFGDYEEFMELFNSLGGSEYFIGNSLKVFTYCKYNKEKKKSFFDSLFRHLIKFNNNNNSSGEEEKFKLIEFIERIVITLVEENDLDSVQLFYQVFKFNILLFPIQQIQSIELFDLFYKLNKDYIIDQQQQQQQQQQQDNSNSSNSSNDDQSILKYNNSKVKKRKSKSKSKSKLKIKNKDIELITTTSYKERNQNLLSTIINQLLNYDKINLLYHFKVNYYQDYLDSLSLYQPSEYHESFELFKFMNENKSDIPTLIYERTRYQPLDIGQLNFKEFKYLVKNLNQDTSYSIKYSNDRELILDWLLRKRKKDIENGRCIIENYELLALVYYYRGQLKEEVLNSNSIFHSQDTLNSGAFNYYQFSFNAYNNSTLPILKNLGLVINELTKRSDTESLNLIMSQYFSNENSNVLEKGFIYFVLIKSSFYGSIEIFKYLKENYSFIFNSFEKVISLSSISTSSSATSLLSSISSTTVPQPPSILSISLNSNNSLNRITKNHIKEIIEVSINNIHIELLIYFYFGILSFKPSILELLIYIDDSYNILVPAIKKRLNI